MANILNVVIYLTRDILVFNASVHFHLHLQTLKLTFDEIVLPVSMSKGVEVEKTYKVHKMCAHFFIICLTIND